MAHGSEKCSPAASISPLIAEMTKPEFYPDHPDSVELKQTHISYVLLAGDFVYKVKKPVRFFFLDQSSRARRLRLCHEEIRLNRRLAPEVYLDVVPIVRRNCGYALGAPNECAAAEEYAVRMRRLDSHRMLDVLVKSGEADGAMMRAIAERMARFHAAASTRCAWRFGAAAAVWNRVIGDLAEYESFIGYTVEEPVLRAIEEFCRAFIADNWAEINRRARSGMVRDGHGDLRAEQICVNGGINIFDCIEFSEKIRYCDVASETGFLAMDLDRLGARKLAQHFVSAYAALSGDEGHTAMLPFYKCYRACIRGMVESQRSQQREVPEPEREAARSAASAYFAQAHRYAMLARPAIVVVLGLSGTGKSTVSRALHDRLGFAVVNSDSVRKRIAGVAQPVRSGAGYSEGIYSEDFTSRTYAAMLADARAHLCANRGVILDATYRDPANRRAVMAAAREARAPVLFVECRCDEQEIIRRLEQRARDGHDPSDATVEVYLRQRTEFAPLGEIPAACRMTVDSERDPIDSALEIEDRIAQSYTVSAGTGVRAA